MIAYFLLKKRSRASPYLTPDPSPARNERIRRGETVSFALSCSLLPVAFYAALVKRREFVPSAA